MEYSVATYLLVISNFVLLRGETTVPWYEDLPAVAMDYKVHIDAGKEDCYFQFVNPGATFYASFQVSGFFLITCLPTICLILKIIC